jgi:membrane protein required for colicin V production
LGELVKKPELTLMDRLGGMVFGVAHGLIVVIVLVMLSGLTALPGELWWQESKLIPSLQSFSIWLRDTVPSDMTDYIRYR